MRKSPVAFWTLEPLDSGSTRGRCPHGCLQVVIPDWDQPIARTGQRAAQVFDQTPLRSRDPTRLLFEPAFVSGELLQGRNKSLAIGIPPGRK